jgi:hypothetical protein
MIRPRLVAIVALAGAAVSAHAEILGVQVTEVDFSNGYLLADGSVYADTSAAVGNAWTTFSQDWKTYRLWATVDTADTTLAGFVGSQDDAYPLVLDPGTGGAFFNEATFGGDTAINAATTAINPMLAFDTYLTLGSATSEGLSPTILDADNQLGGLAGLVEAEDFGVITTTPTPGAGVVGDGFGGWRVLLGQFTVAADSEFSGQGRLIGGGQIVEVDWTTAPIPSPGVPALLTVVGVIGRRRRRAR